MASELLVLMFHAIADAPVAGADAHYTVRRRDFAAMLDALLADGARIGCARAALSGAEVDVALTFDDGDATHFHAAWPELRARGLRADFFVNPARVGTPGLCDWQQLAAMARDGQSIQSHGDTHAYFTQLAPSELERELRGSRETLERSLHAPVTLLAPPGGRAPRGLAALARRCGYTHVLGSTPGVWGGEPGRGLVPRVALTAAHRVADVLAWHRGRARALAGLRARHATLGLAKKVLGDARYERIRAALLGAPA